MNFAEILRNAKAGNGEAVEELFKLYLPLLKRASFVDGVFDEDLFQENCCVLLLCVRKYRADS